MVDLKLDQERLEQAIVDRAVDELLGGEGRIDVRIGDEIKRQVSEVLAKTLHTRIEAALNEVMSRALDTEMQPVSVWGEREGNPTTIRAALHERARNFWNEKVDSKGEKSTYGGRPRWEHVLSIMATKEFESAIKQDIVNVAAAIKDSVRETFYAEVDAKLNEYFKVKSAEDQKRKK
jgi:hypothetical protein